jgi:hypothetical protein
MANGLSPVIPAHPSFPLTRHSRESGNLLVLGAQLKKIPAFAGMTGKADESGTVLAAIRHQFSEVRFLINEEDQNESITA